MRILIREGVRLHVSGFFFKSVVQSVLLFGEETWVVTPCTGRFLGGFLYQVVQRLTMRLLWQREEGKWGYSSTEAFRAEAGFEMMETYIWRRQNTVVGDNL